LLTTEVPAPRGISPIADDRLTVAIEGAITMDALSPSACSTQGQWADARLRTSFLSGPGPVARTSVGFCGVRKRRLSVPACTAA